MAAPMPLEAPVTMATLPVSLLMMIGFFLRRVSRDAAPCAACWFYWQWFRTYEQCNKCQTVIPYSIHEAAFPSVDRGRDRGSNPPRALRSGAGRHLLADCELRMLAALLGFPDRSQSGYPEV